MGDEWRRQSRHWQQSRDPSDDDEHLDRNGKREPGGDEFAVGVACLERCLHASGDEDGVEDDERREPHEAEFLTDGGEDEVGVRDGHLFGIATSESGAGDPTPRQAEQCLRELVAALVVVADGVDEVVNACLDLGGDVVDSDGPDGGKPKSDNDPRRSRGGDVEHAKHGSEEKEGGAEVVFAGHDDEGDRPYDEDGSEIA